MPLLRRLRPGLALLAVLAFAGCGQQTDERKFIAESRADQLTSALDRVQRDLQEGDCERAASGVSRVREEVDDLPSRTDARLVANLGQWVDYLEQQVPQDCTEAEEEETPTPEPTETPEETVTPEPTETPEPTATPVPTVTPAPTVPGGGEGGEGGGGDEGNGNGNGNGNGGGNGNGNGNGGGGSEQPSTGGVVPDEG